MHGESGRFFGELCAWNLTNSWNLHMTTRTLRSKA